MATNAQSDGQDADNANTSELDSVHYIKTKERFQMVEGDDIQFLPADNAQLTRDVFNHHAQLTHVATQLSQLRKGVNSADPNIIQTTDSLVPVDSRDSTMDPDSPDFNVYKWAKTTMHAFDKANIKLRQASFSFKNLNVSGSSSSANFQPSVASIFMTPFRVREHFSLGKRPEKGILRHCDGVVKPGELLLVLGCPGSGCSTFLKTMAGDLNGLKVDSSSDLHYNGISQKEMVSNYKGEIVYNSETDNHFPHLTVRQTLEFAAAVRTPRNHVIAISRKENIRRVTAVAMAVCGLTRSQNTRVGNDFIRGVSGGERKRVSIAEMIVASAPIGCWDNSTRGLDAATALQFVKTLRTSADIFGTTHAVSIYQASQSVYDVFDKVMVLYEGREIFFGPASSAKDYFLEMGWDCPPRQTTGDFLTSVTSHLSRNPRPGYEARVPRSADDFEKYWKLSNEHAAVQREISLNTEEAFQRAADIQFKESRRAAQARHLWSKSRYIVSIPMQLKICTKRSYQRLWNNKISTVTVVVGQIVMALIVGSVFFGTANNTASFFARGSTLFFAVLLNALIAVTEINDLYQQRPIVIKQTSYAFCHPFVEALAGVVSDAPVKLIIAICFNLILYFLSGLDPTPARFFTFFLFTVLVRFTMSAMFRSLAAATESISQAMAMAGVLVLAIVIYTGYTIPVPYMKPWFRWLNYINPLAYAFEALMANEFHDREFPCASFVPPYPNLSNNTFICSASGAVMGETTVSGDAYIGTGYEYSYSHTWRNLGILIGFWIFFLTTYLVATELNSSKSSKADVLLFLRGENSDKDTDQSTKEVRNVKDSTDKILSETTKGPDPEADSSATIPKDIFTWSDIVYTIKIKEESRTLLDHVSGWVKPRTLTALMGVSGAGKTTLLDALALRLKIGVITGESLLGGKPLSPSFQSQTGYVQQQDLHLETSTVREAVRFSAVLRQPASVSKAEKYKYAEEVIEMLEMQDFAGAIVGIPGEGLNVEQRKRLTIAVELAAKPAVLLFLDEPTSGLDSESSWAIVCLLRKLANNGQAILATIHQPSSVLFQQFDRLLFLAKGGRTVYFGDLGPNSRTVINYFSSHGARSCGGAENPAEYILDVVAAKIGPESNVDWPEAWKSSEESRCVRAAIEYIQQKMAKPSDIRRDQKEKTGKFSAPLSVQIWYTTIRVFQQYWRTPSYIWGKFMLGTVAGLFIGFSFFQSNNSLQGMQNIIFSIFMATAILSTLVQQVIPRFLIQRSLYEVRERPSNTYSWVAFMIANILVEIPYQVFLGIVVFAAYSYPIFGILSPERQGLILLYCIQIFVFASTFAHMIIAALPDAQTAGAVATLIFSLTMIFNGVFQPVQALPGFWIFMYRVSPLTYIVDGIAATALHGEPVLCSQSETLVFEPVVGMTCGAYLQAYLTQAPGQLLNPSSTTECRYCPLSNSDQFLATSSITWDTRWRNFGIVWAYIVFNIVMSMVLYYTFRVRTLKWSKPFRTWWKRTFTGFKVL